MTAEVRAELKAGDTAYTINGHEVELIAKTPDGKWIAYPIKDTDEGPQYGRSAEYAKLFAEAPVDRIDQKCAELSQKQSDLEAKIGALTAQATALEREHAERMKRLTGYAGLETFEDCLTGRICWFVTKNYGGISVLSVDDAIKEDHGYRDTGGIKLVRCLAWSSEARWSIAAYNTGGRSFDRAYPCVTREQAVAKAAEWLSAEFDDYLHERRHVSIEGALKSADELDIAVPADVSAKYTASQLRRYDSSIADMKSKLAAAEAEREKFATTSAAA